MADIHSIRFATTGWVQQRTTSKMITWQRENGDALALEFFPFATNLPADLRDPAGIRQYHEALLTANGGALVSFDIIQLQALEAVQQIAKFRYPGSNPLRLVYVGSMMFPFRDYSYVIRVQMMEGAVTGTREAAVSLLTHPQSISKPEEAIQVTSMEELFQRIAEGPVQRTPSDDEQYDAIDLNHPLSRVRQYLLILEKTLDIAPDVRGAAPFRVA